MKGFVKGFSSHRSVSFLLGIILVLALFVRVYRVDQILGFYYDQGRDALVIWDLIHKGKLFLIGPTTGIAGIFSGPWYYYLITPFYWLGKGNPVYPSVFLAFLSIVAIFFKYIIGREVVDETTGLLAAFISSFSFYLVYASRWLSNPTPMLLVGVLLAWGMLRAIEKKRWAWPLIAFLVGMGLQFGSSTEVFYVPAVLVFAFWQKRNLPKPKILVLSMLIFLASAAPLIIFDFRHGFILSTNFKKFFIEDESFRVSFWETIKVRLPFYYDVFSSKLWPGENYTLRAFLLIALGILIVKFKELWKKDGFKILLLLFISPLIGMLFFQGNEGNVYDYYFTSYYLGFVLIFSILLGTFAKNQVGKIVLVLFLIFFLKINVPIVRGYITAGVDGPTTIALGNEKEAIDWIYKDAGNKDFNVDVYVPPVIPYAYDYLFKWLGTEKYHKLPAEQNISLLYTLYEVDPPHPERLNAWLARQKGIGKVVYEAKFGGITVERRVRIQ